MVSEIFQTGSVIGTVNLCQSLWRTVYPKKYAHGFALLCFVVVIHWLIFPYPSGLLHWHCGNLTIAPVPAKQPWWIWINTSYEFIMNDCITTTKQSTTKACAYFLGYTVDQTCWATAKWRYCLCQNVQSPHGARQFLGFFVGYKVSICASINIKTTYTHIRTYTHA